MYKLRDLQIWNAGNPLTRRELLSLDMTSILPERNDNYFAICAVVKNEQDLPEWIEYHRRMGCSKFYLFDNNSSTPLINSIMTYVSNELVDYSFIAKSNVHSNPQIYVYDK